MRVASVDNWYGILAVAILVVGFSRTIYAAKGWAYYQANGWRQTFSVDRGGVLRLYPDILAAAMARGYGAFAH